MARDTTALPPGLEPDEDIGFGEHEGPESQGEFAGEPFGRGAQGTYGDEDRDPSSEHSEPPPADDPLTTTTDDGVVGRTLEAGPRPDAGIVEEVSDRLDDALELHPADVVVVVDGGIVKLAGMVESERLRTAAEELVLGIAGVRGVDNGLVVRDDT